MTQRLVSVGDDLTVPAALKLTDANLPAASKATAVTAAIAAAIAGSMPPTTLDGGNATSSYTGSFNFDGGSAA